MWFFCCVCFFFKQKTAYELRISDWSSDVCSSDLTVLLNTNGIDQEWFYRADTANWVKYAPLIAADTFPFPEEFDNYFILMLAMEINPTYGQEMNQLNLSLLQRSKRPLPARYQQIIQVPNATDIDRKSAV